MEIIQTEKIIIPPPLPRPLIKKTSLTRCFPFFPWSAKIFKAGG